MMSTKSRMETKIKIHSPDYIGPGIWYMLHSLAIDSETNNDYDFFVKLLTKTVNNLGCKYCKKHGLEYLSRNNPNLINKNLTPSQYINKFHNTVNIRLGKPIYSLDKSREMFKNICKSCEIGEMKNKFISTKVTLI